MELHIETDFDNTLVPFRIGHTTLYRVRYMAHRDRPFVSGEPEENIVEFYTFMKEVSSVPAEEKSIKATIGRGERVGLN